MTPNRRALRAAPLALAAGLFLVAQKPAQRPSQTFSEQVEVREVELVIDLAGSLSRLKRRHSIPATWSSSKTVWCGR